MNRVFFIADTHFNHTNVIEYTNRSFETIEEMDNYMIKQWNNAVSDNDTVYHLGDFALGLSDEEYIDLLSNLNGRIFLIQGNHDRKGKRKLRQLGFADVYNDFEFGDFVLTHRPMDVVPKDKINMHGHTHKTTIYGKNSINVSVEAIDYRPINLDTLI